MDGSIRLRTTRDEAPAAAAPHLARPRTPETSAAATSVANLRRAILDCVAYSILEAPVDREARLQTFAARLSATMELIGEPDLDRALWNLLEQKPTMPSGSDVARWMQLTGKAA